MGPVAAGAIVVAAVLAAWAASGFGAVSPASAGHRVAGAPTPPPTSTPPDPAATDIVSAPADGGYGPTASWVVAENRRPGTSAWRITGATPGNIAGFASTTSVTAGRSVTLYVTTDAPSYRVDAYRMGWYGGAGARLVWSSGTLTGSAQPKCTVTSTVNMVSCLNWTPSLTVPITTRFVQGDYLFELLGSGGQRSYVPLTVTDPSSHAAFLVKNDIYTWQAWNPWGGYDFYQGIGTCHATYPVCNRARIVSFDRPYADGQGTGDFLTQEYPLVEFMERYGLDITYTTDTDVDADPAMVSQHRAILSLGHDECWSLAERKAVQDAATSKGLNVFFFGASPMLRHVRPAPSPLGPDREVVDYRDSSEDPLDHEGGDPLEVTGNTWSSPPANWDEVPFVGSVYTGYVEPGLKPVAMVVTDASSWIYRGTGLLSGQSLPGVIWSDVDQYQPHAGDIPGNVEVLAHSPLPRDEVQTSARVPYSDVTYYTQPSGAGIFDTGSTTWIPSMDDSTLLSQITGNVLTVFGSGPAGHTQPSTGNWKNFYG